MACLRGCKVTLVTFVWLFPTVRFHVFLQIDCLRGCKVTLVAFVWLFSTVRFHVCPQMACPWGCKVTLVAFVSLFPTEDNVYCDDDFFLGQLVYMQKPKQLWKLSKLITNGTNKEKRKNSKIPNQSWYENIRHIPYRKIPVYRDFAKIPYRTVPEWNSSYRWGLPATWYLPPSVSLKIP